MEDSIREKRIKSIVFLYYSKPEVQKAIYEFCENREIAPSFMMESFGKRPDTFQYPGDLFELVKRGATSFHCSEEIWEDPLKIETGMSEEELNQLREGWDLLLDIDCKYFDYSRMAAVAIVETLERFGVKNLGIKFSGSKGFHIIVPWKAFPKTINQIKTSDLFPELPRKIIGFLRDYSERVFKESLPEDYEKQFENAKVKKGIKCKNCNELAEVYEEVELYCPFCKVGETRKVIKENVKEKYSCPNCKRDFVLKNKKQIFECKNCNISSKKNPENFSSSIEVDLFDLMGLDLILVSPRHLFRTPYSLHEKTGLASIVLTKEELKNFEPKHANAMNVRIRNFLPDCKEEEAKEIVTEALDWSKTNEIKKGINEKVSGKYAEFKPIKLKEIKDEQFPPCVKKILNGLEDGRKRGVFILINVFRSLGMDKTEMEKRIFEWNKKNKPPLKEGYILAQLKWSYGKKPIMPPNCKQFYQGIGVCSPDEFCSRIKNPLNYIIKKNLSKKHRANKKNKNY